MALHCIRRIKARLFIVMVYIRGLPDACVPSTLAVQEAEQLYRPGYKTLMEYLGRGMVHLEVVPGLEP